MGRLLFFICISALVFTAAPLKATEATARSTYADDVWGDQLERAHREALVTFVASLSCDKLLNHYMTADLCLMMMRRSIISLDEATAFLTFNWHNFGRHDAGNAALSDFIPQNVANIIKSCGEQFISTGTPDGISDDLQSGLILPNFIGGFHQCIDASITMLERNSPSLLSK